MSIDQDVAIRTGLAYDDVLLVPQHSEILPKQVRLETKLTSTIKLKIPILSAAMDTVTEDQTAIAMAQAGGIGIIHKNQSIEEQAKQVSKVKKSESGMVTDPITLNPNDSLQHVHNVMEEMQCSGFPVVDNGKLVGIITGRDIRFEQSLSKRVADVMTREVITVQEGTSFDDIIALIQHHRIEKLPVLDKTGTQLVGLFTVKDIMKAKRFPDASKDNAGRLIVGAAVGASGDFHERALALASAGADVVVVDTAHGHSQGVIDAVKALSRNLNPKSCQIIAGNVATGAGTRALIDAGANAVKIGIGPGSICTTRIVAGVGVPQLTAVLDCAKAAKETDVPIIADGGIKFSGDIVKALAAGAATIMVGSLLAGTDEAPGDLIIYQGKSFKQYRGMGSLGAMQKGSKDRYFQSDISDVQKLVPEGIEGRIAYRGPLLNTLHQLTGGLRSGMGYLGAASILDLQNKAEFIRLSAAGLKESHVHDVYITHEAPNYKLS